MVCGAAAMFAVSSGQAAELLVNGDFETGTFAGWTVTDLAGGTGTWFIDTPGTTTPSSGIATSAAGGAPHGSFYAVTDQTGPGTHVLTQSFTVSAGRQLHWPLICLLTIRTAAQSLILSGSIILAQPINTLG